MSKFICVYSYTLLSSKSIFISFSGSISTLARSASNLQSPNRCAFRVSVVPSITQCLHLCFQNSLLRKEQDFAFLEIRRAARMNHRRVEMRTVSQQVDAGQPCLPSESSAGQTHKALHEK